MFSDHITTNLINNTKQIEFICTWKVNDFTERTLNTGEILESSFFSEKAVGEDLKFKFYLYPRGLEHDKYLSIYLIFSSPNPLSFIFEGTFAASILDNLDKRNYEQTMTFTNKLLYPNGFHRFVKREFIINQPNKFLVDGHLKFCCHIKLSMDCLSATININENLQTLLNSPIGSDVILRAGDKNFNVHKNILCTRSPVLCNIIERCIERNNSNIIYIPDIEEDVMHEILTFIYKRNISNTSYELIKKLAPAADKYDVYGLMPLCEELLSQYLVVINAIDILEIAVCCNLENLKSKVLQFIKSNMQEIIKTLAFARLLDSVPQQATFANLVCFMVSNQDK